MFKDSVAQKPTIPVNAGKKKFQNSLSVVNFEGSFKIGPNPLLASIAQNNKARAATGKKIALNTKSFLIVSTPNQTISMLSNQKRKKQIAGPVANPNDAGNIGGK